jgi:hypothetical protein
LDGKIKYICIIYNASGNQAKNGHGWNTKKEKKKKKKKKKRGLSAKKKKKKKKKKTKNGLKLAPIRAFIKKTKRTKKRRRRRAMHLWSSLSRAGVASGVPGVPATIGERVIAATPRRESETKNELRYLGNKLDGNFDLWGLDFWGGNFDDLGGWRALGLDFGVVGFGWEEMMDAARMDAASLIETASV